MYIETRGISQWPPHQLFSGSSSCQGIRHQRKTKKQSPVVVMVRDRQLHFGHSKSNRPVCAPRVGAGGFVAIEKRDAQREETTSRITASNRWQIT